MARYVPRHQRPLPRAVSWLLLAVALAGGLLAGSAAFAGTRDAAPPEATSPQPRPTRNDPTLAGLDASTLPGSMHSQSSGDVHSGRAPGGRGVDPTRSDPTLAGLDGSTLPGWMHSQVRSAPQTG